MTVSVRASGPLFDGRGPAVTREMCTESARQISDRGAELVRGIIRSSVRESRGYYVSQIAADVHGTRGRVHDNDVVYGPWLEGVSRRNQSTPFKGHHQFRKAAQRLQGESLAIAERVVSVRIDGLG